MEQKNIILAVGLSLIVLLGWNFWEQSQMQERAALEQTRQQSQIENGTLPAPSETGEIGGRADIMPAPVGSENVILRPRHVILQDSARVEIVSDRLKGSIRLTGAKLDDLTLLDFRESIEDGSPEVVFLKPVGTRDPYYASFGWWANAGIETPDGESVWTSSADKLTPENPVTLSWKNAQGILFRQTYRLDENFMFSVEQSVTNTSAAEISIAPYGLISRSSTPDISGFYILHEGPIGVFDGVLEETDYDDIADMAIESHTSSGSVAFDSLGGWVGITDKYWLMALIPGQNESVKARHQAISRGDDFIYQSDFLGATTTLAAGASITSGARLFAGAKETLLLDKYRDDPDNGIVNFDKAVDFGLFYYLTKPIFYAVHWLNELLGNFGLAILALTLVIKIFLFPLANKSYVSMSRMKLLQPKMKDLKDRFGDDRQKLNQAMMELYKKEKVNPLSGCLPILVQIPIFFALYKVLFVAIEMRHAPFFGWIQDLSAQDPLGILTLFGLIDWNVPQVLAILNIGIWPLIMGFTMWLQQRLNPAPTDPVQAKVFMFMPIIFTFMLGTFPAGLVIYWAWNNILSMAQQWMIMRRMGVAVSGGKIENAK